VSGSEIMQLQ
jgi:hypothetical protein